MCLPPVTKSAQVTWYKQAKGVQPEKMHRASTKRKSVSASKIVKGRAPVKTFFFFFFFLGGRAIHYTYMYVQRKKPQVSNGRPSTAEAASYPHYLGRGRHKSLPRGNTSGKTSSLQGSCSPAYSQACSFSTNKASPLSESTQHSCQDHKYNEVPSKASSRQDSRSPSTCQARFISLDKRQAHA